MSILDTFLQLLQTMGPNILHSEFLSFVRNVSTLPFLASENNLQLPLDSASLRQQLRQFRLQSVHGRAAEVRPSVQRRVVEEPRGYGRRCGELLRSSAQEAAERCAPLSRRSVRSPVPIHEKRYSTARARTSEKHLWICGKSMVSYIRKSTFQNSAI